MKRCFLPLLFFVALLVAPVAAKKPKSSLRVEYSKVKDFTFVKTVTFKTKNNFELFVSYGHKGEARQRPDEVGLTFYWRSNSPRIESSNVDFLFGEKRKTHQVSSRSSFIRNYWFISTHTYLPLADFLEMAKSEKIDFEVEGYPSVIEKKNMAILREVAAYIESVPAPTPTATPISTP